LFPVNIQSRNKYFQSRYFYLFQYSKRFNSSIRKPRKGPSGPRGDRRRTRMAQAALVVLLALSLHAGGSGVAQAVAVVASRVCCKLGTRARRRPLQPAQQTWSAIPARTALMLTGSAYAAAPLLRRGPCHAQQQICAATERMRHHAVAARQRGRYHAPQGGREKEQSPG
jgi:hypothetical protein